MLLAEECYSTRNFGHILTECVIDILENQDMFVFRTIYCGCDSPLDRFHITPTLGALNGDSAHP